MIHGGDLTEAIACYGGATEQWLDLSTGINPWPWPIPADLPPAVWQRLPAAAALDGLLTAARNNYQIPSGTAIAAAPGTQALIQWLPRLAPPGSVAIMSPTYNEHARAWTIGGHDVVRMRSDDDIPDGVRNVIIVNPNNPNGRVVALDVIASIAKTLRERGGWLILDEAFVDTEPSASAVALCCDLPIVVLRSFGKFYGLAGLRLGFAIGAPDIIRRVSEALGPWPCSGPAIHIASRALEDRVWIDRMREQLKRRANDLDDVLQRAGFEIAGGTSLFRLARRRDAVQTHAVLAKRYIWCRSFEDCDDLLRFGLPPRRDDLLRLAAELTA